MNAPAAPGHVFIVPGDLTQLRADVLVYSTSTAIRATGHLHEPFASRFPWFNQAIQVEHERVRARGRGGAVGSTFLLEPPERKGPAVIVVASTIDQQFGTETREHVGRNECARRAVRGALAAAQSYLTSQKAVGRQLVALPTFRMGLGGDRNDRLRSASTQVGTAWECLADMAGIDVAIVPFTPDNYQIFLQARRQVLGRPSPCPLPEGGDSARLTDLVRQVRAGRCVLFVGSGMSRQLPDWLSLLKDLAADLGREPPKDFGMEEALALADDFVWERGGSRLSAEIRKRFLDYDRESVAPTHSHYQLLTLPLRLVMTTNYDDLLERSLSGLRKHHRLVSRDKDVLHTGSSEPLCVVKLHGDPQVDGGRGLVLARGQYEAFRVQHPGLALLLSGSLLNQTFLFIGYSRRDPNFKEIFDEVANLYSGGNWQAFALSVDPPGGPSREGQLELLQMPGTTMTQRARELALFLDWLADAVILGSMGASSGRGGTAAHLPAGLFLSPDVRSEGVTSSDALRAGLVGAVADAVEQALDSESPPLIPQEARHLARVLRFLVEQGWRPAEQSGEPAGVRLSQFWERLAVCLAADPVERDRCLSQAWRFAERHPDVRRIGTGLGHE